MYKPEVYNSSKGFEGSWKHPLPNHSKNKTKRKKKPSHFSKTLKRLPNLRWNNSLSIQVFCGFKFVQYPVEN